MSSDKQNEIKKELVVCNDGMLDIETMGNKPGAPVTAIGLQLFDLETRTLGAKFYTEISLESCIDAGLAPDASTILWWLQQSEEARAQFIGNETAPELSAALMDMILFLSQHGVTVKSFRPWGNSNSFDCGILAAACRAVDIKQPWEHWNERDCRTIKNLVPSVKIQRVGIHHNALDDAISQTLHLFTLADMLEVDTNLGKDYVKTYVEDAAA